jgi:hypothetical protein
VRWLKIATAALSVAAATTVLTALAGPAEATNVGTIPGVESRCHNSTYNLCLYYNSTMRTAWWGTSVAVSNLAGRTFFPNTGAGSGQPVKNNAAAISCDIPANSICYVFVNSGFTGDDDMTYGQRSGVLDKTKNNNASVKISWAA